MNRYVFRFLLNVSVVLLSLTLLGRVFQSLGPYTLNDLLANVCLFVEGTSSRSLVFEECNLGCFIFFLVMSFCRYVGAWLFWHLYMCVAILKSILSLIGSQCRYLLISVALSFMILVLPIVILAAQFCVPCIIFMSVFGIPDNMALALSRCDMTSDCTNC